MSIFRDALGISEVKLVVKYHLLDNSLAEWCQTLLALLLYIQVFRLFLNNYLLFNWFAIRLVNACLWGCRIMCCLNGLLWGCLFLLVNLSSLCRSMSETMGSYAMGHSHWRLLLLHQGRSLSLLSCSWHRSTTVTAAISLGNRALDAILNIIVKKLQL